MANANRIEPAWLRKVRASLLNSRNFWQDVQDIMGDLNLMTGTSTAAKVWIADGRAWFGLVNFDVNHGGAVFDSINKDVRLRQNGITSFCAPIGANGSALIGKPAPALTSVDGFPYLPVVAGTPTGVPTARTGYAPMVLDSTGNKIWVYVGGGWKSAALA